MSSLKLKLSGFQYEDIYDAERLPVLDELFTEFLRHRNIELSAQFQGYRKVETPIDAVEESGLIIDVARHLEDFLVSIVYVKADRNTLRHQHMHVDPIHAFND